MTRYIVTSGLLAIALAGCATTPAYDPRGESRPVEDKATIAKLADAVGNCSDPTVWKQAHYERPEKGWGTRYVVFCGDGTRHGIFVPDTEQMP